VRAPLCSLAIILVSAAANSAAQPAPPRESAYIQDSWSLQDGLPPGSVEGMAQTPDGYLWLGTASGLVRFDGVNFDLWPLPTQAADAPPEAVLSLTTTRDGALWAGLSSSGIVRIARDGVTVYDTDDGLERTRVTGLLESRDGSLWASTRVGLFHFSDGRWTKAAEADGLPSAVVLSTFEDSSGALWAGTAVGVYRRGLGEARFVRMTNESLFLPRFAEDVLGHVWMTDPELGYRRITKPLPSGTRRFHGTGYRIVADAVGNLWIGTLGDGLWRIDPRQERAPEVESLSLRSETSSSTAITTLFCDREGAIWVGTESGLYRFARRTLTTIAGLSQVRALAATSDGSVWIGTSSGLYRSSEQRRPLYDAVPVPGGPIITALHAADDGALWVATNNGVVRLKNDRAETINTNGPFLNRTYSIVSDRSGAVWVCDESHGVFVWTRAHPQTLVRDPRLGPCMRVTAVPTRTDRIRIQGPAGVVEAGIDGYLGAAGDISQSLDRAPVPADPHARVLSWTADSVVVSVAGSPFNVGLTNGLPKTRIVSALTDLDGNVWIGTLAGIVRVSRAELDTLRRDPGGRLAFQLFDSVDGAGPPKEGNPGVVRTRDGTLWFATASGVTLIDPATLRHSPGVSFPVYVRRLVVDGRTRDLRDDLELPPGTRAVQFTYAAIAFSSPRSIRFEYRLDGFDADWVDGGIRRETIYTNLPPHEYRFRVRAVDKTGTPSADEGVVSFVVAPAFYRTPAFAALVIFAGAASLAGAWRLHARHLRRRFALILSERMRISREIHDTLLQGLIGIALRLDGISEELAAAPAVRMRLVRTREIAEQFIRETRESIWRMREPSRSIAPLVGSIDEMASRMDVRGGPPVRVTVVGTPQPMPAEREDHLFRVVEEAVSNALRHADAQTISVVLDYGDDLLRATVRDDGRGFDEAMLTGSARHYGLVMMRERVQLLSGTFALESAPGRGTEITVTVPLPADGMRTAKRRNDAEAI
jgi:signal transduction histidine kinase/ligand-binding sensor domain-containing protein